MHTRAGMCCSCLSNHTQACVAPYVCNASRNKPSPSVPLPPSNHCPYPHLALLQAVIELISRLPPEVALDLGALHTQQPTRTHSARNSQWQHLSLSLSCLTTVLPHIHALHTGQARSPAEALPQRDMPPHRRPLVPPTHQHRSNPQASQRSCAVPCYAMLCCALHCLSLTAASARSTSKTLLAGPPAPKERIRPLRVTLALMHHCGHIHTGTHSTQQTHRAHRQQNHGQQTYEQQTHGQQAHRGHKQCTRAQLDLDPRHGQTHAHTARKRKSLASAYAVSDQH
jgi:hypothetical protein